MGNGHYHPFNALSDETRDSFTGLYIAYLTAKTECPAEIPRIKDSWNGRIKNAINGAQTSAALQELKGFLSGFQELPIPNNLMRNLDSKMEMLERTAINKARKESRRATPRENSREALPA